VTDQAANLRWRVGHAATAVGSSAAAGSTTSQVSHSCHSIAVTSGKGGVGKSNISLLLAQALSRLRKRVLLFDADLGLANIHILLGLNPRYNLAHVFKGECELEQILCAGPEGVTVVPGASGVEAMANLDALSVERLVRKLAELEARHDFILVDIGAGIGPVPMRLSCAAESALLVMTPEPTSLADAYATAKLMFARGMERIAVMVNMAVSEQDGAEVFEKLQALVKNFLGRNVSLAGIIPFDKDVPRFVRAQRNILLAKPSSPLSTRIGSYARVLCGMQTARKGGFFARLFQQKPASPA